MTGERTRWTLYLVDAHALLFQVFHAIPAMTSPSGMPTNALFGFTRDLLYLRQVKKPDALICVFDPEGPTFRDRLYSDYKAQRGAMPDDLQLQLQPIRQVLQAMNVPVISVPGFEADDVIATLATAAAAQGADVFICTNDKDCRQLISDHIRLFNLRKQEVFDRSSLVADWGVTPEQVVDLQALVGDSVDNVPGVPGIGIKTAAQLLQQYGTLDNLLAHADEVVGAKRRENLKAAAARVALSRQLVKLNTAVPLEMPWDAWRLQPMNTPELIKLLRHWGLNRLVAQVQAIDARDRPRGKLPLRRRKAVLAEDIADLFSDTAVGTLEPPAAPENKAEEIQLPPGTIYHLVDRQETFSAFLQQLGRQGRFAFDLETTSLETWVSEVVGISFCWQPGEAWYLCLRAPKGSPHLDIGTVLESLRPLFENPRVAKVNQNIKYDLLVLRWHGIEVAGVAGDPMVADYLLRPGERSHNLDALARYYLGREKIPIELLLGKKGKSQKRLDELPPARVAVYAGVDADLAWQLCQHLESRLDQGGLRPLYDDLEVPLIDVLASMEHTGIRLDVPRLQQLGKALGDQLRKVEKEIYDLAGEQFNIASLKQLRQVLYDRLKLPVRRKTGITGEASTDQETLEWLAARGHALPRKILEQRRLAKLKGTYIDPLPALVNPRTGRIHASFNQTVTETGRLSSSDPNLQNIPIRSDDGGQIRQAFVPEEGWLLLTADYSQIELRLLAHFSGDPDLRRAFAEEHDIHTLVAAQIHGVSEKDVTPAMRRLAKTVNFGVIYGMSARGLAQRLTIPTEEAEQFIRQYFGRYPRVLEYQQHLLQRCRETGFVSTILGRRRWFDPQAIRPDSTYQQRNQAEREAINMEIQGSAADLIKTAMVSIYRRLRQEGWQTRLLLQIHDELVFETPPAELRDVSRMIAREMTLALEDRLQVPLRVEVSAGPNWLDVSEVNG